MEDGLEGSDETRGARENVIRAREISKADKGREENSVSTQNYAEEHFAFLTHHQFNGGQSNIGFPILALKLASD